MAFAALVFGGTGNLTFAVQVGKMFVWRIDPWHPVAVFLSVRHLLQHCARDGGQVQGGPLGTALQLTSSVHLSTQPIT